MSRARAWARAATAIAGLLSLAVPTAAQVEATPVLSGLVLRAGEPLGGVPVVLHRVDAVDAGSLDTLLAAVDGTFAFDLPTVPDPGGRGEVYFASVDHQGVLYFGPPVATAAELDPLYRIEVFDTLTAPPGGADLDVAVRYLLVDPVEGGWTVTDLVEIVVPEGRTLVPADSAAATWRYRLPAGIGEPQVGGGDVAPVSTSFVGDTLAVSMPLTPGPRQVVLRYTLDSLALELPLPGATGELEVLVREPIPDLELSGLVAVEPVELEPGVFYRRYAAAQLRDSVVSFRAGEGVAGSGGVPVEVLVVLLGLGLAGVGIWAVRAGPAARREPLEAGGPPTRAEPSASRVAGDERQRILLRIARIDERLDGLPEGDERERLAREREDLLSRLEAG